MASLSTSMATTGTAGAVGVVVLAYLQHRGFTLDDETAAGVMTLTIAACHALVEIARYCIAFLPKPPGGTQS